MLAPPLMYQPWFKDSISPSARFRRFDVPAAMKPGPQRRFGAT